MCDEIRLALAEVRRRTPSAVLRGTPGGRRQGPSSVGPLQALLLFLLHSLTHHDIVNPTHPSPPICIPRSSFLCAPLPLELRLRLGRVCPFLFATALCHMCDYMSGLLPWQITRCASPSFVMPPSPHRRPMVLYCVGLWCMELSCMGVWWWGAALCGGGGQWGGLRFVGLWSPRSWCVGMCCVGLRSLGHALWVFGVWCCCVWGCFM